MKFLTIRSGAAWVPAVVDGDQAVVLPERYRDLVAFIGGGEVARAEIAAHIRSTGSARLPLNAVVVGSPITRLDRKSVV